MFLVRRSLAAPSRRLVLRSQQQQQQQQRRSGSHSAHHGPVNESFGRSFYVTIGTFASAYLLYRWSKSAEEAGSKSWVSSLVDKWATPTETLEHRNAIHTAALEKAAHDRHLFQSQGPSAHYELKHNDFFNTGSAINVSPGSQADLSAVAAFYKRQNQQIEEARVARMKDGKVDSIYD